MPSVIMPAPYMPTSCAPAMYSGCRGPGMLVTVQLNTGRMRLASDSRAEVRAPRPTRPPGSRSAMSRSVRAPRALVNSLDLWVPSRTATSRSKGSAMSVPERGEHPRHHVAGGAPLGFRAHRDRRHRDQRIVRQLVLVHQVAAQATADDRQHDVVDRRARHRRLDPAQVLQLEPDRVEHAMGAHRAAPAGARDRRRSAG